MSLETLVEDIIIEQLEKSRHPGVDCAYPELKRDRFANKDFDEVFSSVLDIVEEADIDERARGADSKIGAVAVMVIVKWADDEKLTDDLDDRAYRKVEDTLSDYDELIDRLENGSRRGGGRRSSSRGDERRRGRSRGRDRDDYSASDRDSRSGRNSRSRDEGRRRSSRGSDRSRSRNGGEEPKTLTQRRAEQVREEGQEEVMQPQTPQQISRSRERTNERNRPVREERSYDFVGEKEVAQPKDLSKTEEELGFSYDEVPVGSIADYVELNIDVNDPKFIATRPIDKTDTFREVIYDPFVKQPKWELNADGLRVLRFRDFNMNIDNHVIPDFKRTSVTPARAVNQAVLPSLAQPSRRSILDISKKADEEERRYEDRLNEWEASNKDRPADEQEAKPESPAVQKLGSHTLRVDEAINTSSLGDMMQETMSRFGQLRGFSEGHPPVESFGSLRQFAWCAESAEDRDRIMEQVEMFSTTHSHRSEDGRQVVPIHNYHAALMAVVDTIPYGLWKRINRRMTEYCNDILTVSLGLGVTIDDFAEDGDKIVQYLDENYGQAVMEGFIIGHAQTGGRISMLEAGKGDTDVLIYEVRGTQVTILPVAPDELSISSVKLTDSKSPSAPALVTAESNLRLFNALRTVSTQSTPTLGKQTPFKYIAFSDGTVYRIDRNALGLSGDHKRDTVEFLLTQVATC